ncbi:MAG: ATP-binding protein, partial [Oscillospiraceae bacterium]
YQADLKVLAILENDEDAQKVLNEEEREGENPAEGGSRIFGDFRDNIGPLANREIREVKLSDCVDLRKLNEQGYAGTLKEAEKDAEKLIQNMSTQKPYSRYQNSIAGARVLYDALDNPENRREEQMAEKRSELEGVLFGYLTKALVSLADDMVGRREVDLSVARYYYIEALKYSRTDEQDKQNAITRAILSAVVPRGEIPLLLLDKDRNISLTNQLKDGLMETKKVPAAEVLDLLARIYDATLVDKDKLLKKLCGVIFDAKKGPLFFEPGSAEAYTETALYLRVRERSRSYKRQENEWRAMAKQLLREFSLAPNWLAGAQERFLQQADLLECVDLLDKKRIDEFRSLLIKTVEYNQLGKYSLKEDGLRNLAGRLDELELSIEEHPTKYAFETLLEIIETWRRVISDTLSELYQSRPPELQCKMIAEDGLHIGENGTIGIQLDVTNAPDRQTADSVVIQVIESEEYQVVTPLERKYYIAENNGETIKVTLGGFRETVKAFSVTVEIGYEYNLTEKETAKETRSFNLSVNLGDADFSELENPYEAYAGGATVDDEEMVFGRKDFIERIVNSIKGRGGVPLRRKTIALYGQKRAGKSTILYHLKLALQKEAKNTIVVDLGDCAKLEGDIFEYSLYRTLFKRLGDALKKEHPALQQALLEAGITVPTRAMLKSVSVGRELLGDFFTEFNDFVQRTPAFSQYNVVLMIDEFTNIYIRLCHGKIDSDFMQYWKAIINDYGIVGVVVGQDYMQDFVNAYPNPFAAIDLRQVTYLPEEETRRMITAAPISAEGHRAVFDGLSGERAIQKILQLTACSAYFTMILLDRLMKYLNKMRQTYVTDADIDHLLSDDLLSGSEQINLPRFEFLYNDDGDISDVTRPRHNMVVLWTIVRQFTALGRCKRDDIVFAPELRVAEISPERIDDLLSKLVSRDVLSMDVNGNYSIRIGLFAEWLGRNCSAETINQIKDTVG